MSIHNKDYPRETNNIKDNSNNISQVEPHVKSSKAEISQSTAQRNFVIILSVLTLFAIIALVLINVLQPTPDGGEITIYYPGNISQQNSHSPNLSSDASNNEDSKSSQNENSTQITTVPNTVYWTPGGSVYHIEKSCLSRSTIIESGTVQDAQNSGKENLCKTCEKRLES